MSSASPSTGLLLDEVYLNHDTGAGHPERADRLRAVAKGLKGAGLVERTAKLTQTMAEEEAILRCHSREYLEIVKRDGAAGRSDLRTGDTEISEASLGVGARAGGGGVGAVEEVMAGQLRNAFCAVRPPGHHARPEQGMGFCLFNNVAIGARFAQAKMGAEKVFIVDWDGHHGNGTQDVFYEDGSVLFFSVHQAPWYPYTGWAEEMGEGKGKGLTMNAPLPGGSGMKQIGAILRDQVLPVAAKFKPDLVMISAGFDSRVDDPLGRFTLTDEDFAELTRELMGFADSYCDGRVVSVLEGGYNVEGLTSAVVAHVGALTGDK
ncbi:histone deacetylase [Phragmitibacter flavus]|uniref:Histone deacetylase n=1 Tax=Phragmitibacter flavus TaxID=2576071 RepID=A0A5R8KE82_9BACT|nr:histone deacetylase [Phragmitibacter flavus]TLD70593.1 histone deacetylase [Phragmitibacter flavus]